MPASVNSYMNSHSFHGIKECKSQEKNELPSLPGHLPAPEEMREKFQGKLFFEASTANSFRRQHFVSHYKGQISLSSYVLNMTQPLSKSICQQHQVIKFLSPAPSCSFPVTPRCLPVLSSSVSSQNIPEVSGSTTGHGHLWSETEGLGRPGCWPERNQWDAEAVPLDSSLHPCASVLAL